MVNTNQGDHSVLLKSPPPQAKEIHRILDASNSPNIFNAAHRTSQMPSGVESSTQGNPMLTLSGHDVEKVNTLTIHEPAMATSLFNQMNN